MRGRGAHLARHQPVPRHDPHKVRSGPYQQYIHKHTVHIDAPTLSTAGEWVQCGIFRCVHVSCPLLSRITKEEDGMFTVHYKPKDQEESSVRVGKVMFGTGRKPNTKGIGLEVRCQACMHQCAPCTGTWRRFLHCYKTSAHEFVSRRPGRERFCLVQCKNAFA